LNLPETFFLFVKTNRPSTQLWFDEEKNAYCMDVHAAPEKGKANLEIVKFFKKEHKTDVEIVSGFSSRKKLLRAVKTFK